MLTGELIVESIFFSPKYLDGTLINNIIDSKCRFIAFGAESGSNDILKSIQKGITTEDTLTSAKMCNKYGVTPNYSFMIGLPGETKLDMTKTLVLINEIKKICPKATFNGPQTFRPYPGSKLYEECNKMGLHEPTELWEWIKKDNWDSAHHTGYLSIKDFKWINNPEYVFFIDKYYCSHVLPSIKEFIYMGSYIEAPKTILDVLIKKMRWNLKYFSLFGVEENIYHKILKIYKRLER